MRKYVLIIGVPALVVLLMLAFAACNPAEKAPATQAQTASAPADSAPAASAPIAGEDAPAIHEGHDDHAEAEAGAAEATEPMEITLASGEQVKVVSVVYFDQNMKDMDGLVAIEGKVKESHPDRGALILVDCAVEAGCTDGCCPTAEVPVRLDLTTYDGALPAAEAEVVLIGDLTVQDMGYTLAVREIRQGEEVLLTQKS